MKNSIIVFLFFCAGCLLGLSGHISLDAHHVSLYILYALMLQVGISIGSNKNLKQIIRQIRPKMLVIPHWQPLLERCCSRHWPVCS